MRIRCTRCCLQGSLKALNIGVNVAGVFMIIYSLWLFKAWSDGVSTLPASVLSDLPQPWFIMTCLGVGMLSCLSTLCGYVAVNYTKHSTLCIYVASIFSLVMLQGAVIIAIFFNMDLEEKISKLIDDGHASLRRFIIFHLYLCRWLSILVLVAQINLVLLAATLWVVGTDQRNHSRSHLMAAVPDFRSSFLIYSPVNNGNSNNNIYDDISITIEESRTMRSKLSQCLFG